MSNLKDLMLLIEEKKRLEKRIELYLYSVYPADWRGSPHPDWGIVFSTEWFLLLDQFKNSSISRMNMRTAVSLNELLDEYNVPAE